MVRKALVTGGTRGLGRAIALELLAAGMKVTVTGSSQKGKAPAGCNYLGCDFADAAAVEAFAKKIGSMGFSVLVNNAGINKIGPTEKYSADDFRRIQQVNLDAVFRLTAAVLPGMRRRKYGRIIGVTSIFGVVSREGRAAYSASKFGLFGFLRSVALEAACDNVLVNCVAPGFVETDLTRKVLGEAGMRRAAKQVPVGRLAKPKEIAKLTAFLSGPDNTYVTGQNLVIDGGYTSA